MGEMSRRSVLKGAAAAGIASTIWWAQGLSSPPGHMLPYSHFGRPHGPDARVQKITENFLERAIGTHGRG